MLPAAVAKRAPDLPQGPCAKQAIRQGESQEELEGWRTTLLTVTFHFQLLVSEEERHGGGLPIGEV